MLEARRDPPNPGNAERAAARRGERRPARRVPRRRPADGRLLRQADPQQGRPGAARGAARPRCPCGHRRLRRLPRRSSSSWRTGSTSSSPARSSTGTSCTCSRWRTCLSVPSIFPEAFGMVAAESAAAGCPPVVADHSGLASVADGLEASYPPELHDLVRFPTRTRGALRERLAGILALGPEDRTRDPRCRPPGGGRALELAKRGDADQRDGLTHAGTRPGGGVSSRTGPRRSSSVAPRRRTRAPALPATDWRP